MGDDQILQKNQTATSVCFPAWKIQSREGQNIGSYIK